MDAHLLALGSLLAVSIATSLIPGPTNFLIIRMAMRRGRAAAVAAALGTTLGCVVWCLAAMIGLAALLAAVPWLYQALRIAGGLYLLWFAFTLWRAEPESIAEDGPPPAGGAFWTGFAICLTNPKSVLFFASIFSAYVGPDSPGGCTSPPSAWSARPASSGAWPWRGCSPRAPPRPPTPAPSVSLDRLAAAVMAVFGVGLLWTFG
ncbi:LysE family translocator [Phenylobacterium sp. J367]|uniref:LysE family translocator n=1 Tax=Phenylobacterium sp. J367 TaxID=2898435 RepID=UPI00215124C5|nr:LysE family translocator [Phenylobacterium sp. J367]MCR5879158.1 LysE family translocator [Phenylobacterium sp. J367]